MKDLEEIEETVDGIASIALKVGAIVIGCFFMALVCVAGGTCTARLINKTNAEPAIEDCTREVPN